MIRSCDRKRRDLGRASLAHLGVAEHVRDFERAVTTRESADHAYEGSTHPRQAHFPHRAARPVPRPGAGATSSLQRPHTFAQARIFLRQMAHRGFVTPRTDKHPNYPSRVPVPVLCHWQCELAGMGEEFKNTRKRHRSFKLTDGGPRSCPD